MGGTSVKNRIHEANRQIMALKKALAEVVKKGSYEEEQALWTRYRRLQDNVHRLMEKYLRKHS